MNDERPLEQAGDALSGKELQRPHRPIELKTRRARLLRKIREDQKGQADGAVGAHVEHATAGDDYCDVLARFGIEI